MRTIPGNDHRSFQTPSTWVALFQIDIGTEILYLTPNHTTFTADGQEYQPFPIMLEEITDDGKGDINTVQLVCSDIEGTLSTAIKRSGSIDGNGVVFRVFSVEEDAVIYEESLEVIHCGPINSQTITFELGMFNPFTAQLLVEKFLTDFCWNRYKGKGCWITKADGTFLQPSGFTAGSPDSCTHKMSDCDRHGNILRFNSFPGIPGGGGFV